MTVQMCIMNLTILFTLRGIPQHIVSMANILEFLFVTALDIGMVRQGGFMKSFLQ